jgi:hypothetical protein
MFARYSTRLSLPLFAVLTLLYGCGGGSPALMQQVPINTALLTAPIKPDAQHYGDDLFIYTAQFYGDDASVYKRSGFNLQKVLDIYGFLMPNGTVTTPNGWWYLTNGGGSDVLVYKTMKSGPKPFPSDTLTDYGENPVNVDVTPSRQLVAVSNGGTTSKTGSVSVYLNGATSPSSILTYGSDVLQGEGVAIDHQGNCYWSFNDLKTNTGSIVEFAGCSGSGTLLVSGLINAGGLVFDQSDNLYYVDQALGIYQCNKIPKTKSSCSDIIPVDNKIIFHPTNINFDHKDKSLWVSDAAGYIDAYSLKGNGHGKHGHGSSNELMYPTGNNPYGIAPAPGG